MNKRILSFVTLCILGLMSCEYGYHYFYIVNNLTNETVSLHIRTYDRDTSFLLQANTVDTLYSTEHGIEGSAGPYFQDVSVDLDSFTVIKNSVQSKKNYVKDSSWTFDNGDYKTTISNEEF